MKWGSAAIRSRESDHSRCKRTMICCLRHSSEDMSCSNTSRTAGLRDSQNTRTDCKPGSSIAVYVASCVTAMLGMRVGASVRWQVGRCDLGPLNSCAWLGQSGLTKLCKVTNVAATCTCEAEDSKQGGSCYALQGHSSDLHTSVRAGTKATTLSNSVQYRSAWQKRSQSAMC